MNADPLHQTATQAPNAAAAAESVMKVLIVDDGSTDVGMMNALVRVAGAEPFSFNDPVKALVEGANIEPDLAIVDYMMPDMNRIELIAALRTEAWGRDIPIVIINDQPAETHLALKAGATDFVRRPVDPVEVTARLKNLLNLRETQKQLSDQALWLADEIEKATRVVSDREAEIILRLARAAEYRDGGTGSHILRMALYALVVAQALKLDTALCNLIYRAAPLHDVGKIGISDLVLLKQGPLTPEERLQIEKHTLIGEAILSGSTCGLIQMASAIAAAHHERWDGQGYPRKLKGEDIPLSARIVAVADVFDALTTTRPYKTPWTLEKDGTRSSRAAVRSSIRRASKRLSKTGMRSSECSYPTIWMGIRLVRTRGSLFNRQMTDE